MNTDLHYPGGIGAAMGDTTPHIPPEPWPTMDNVVVAWVEAHRYHRRKRATGRHRPYEPYVALMVELSLAGAILPVGTKLSRTLVWMPVQTAYGFRWLELVRLSTELPPACPNRIRWTREAITMPEVDPC